MPEPAPTAKSAAYPGEGASRWTCPRILLSCSPARTPGSALGCICPARPASLAGGARSRRSGPDRLIARPAGRAGRQNGGTPLHYDGRAAGAAVKAENQDGERRGAAAGHGGEIATAVVIPTTVLSHPDRGKGSRNRIAQREHTCPRCGAEPARAAGRKRVAASGQKTYLARPHAERAELDTRGIWISYKPSQLSKPPCAELLVTLPDYRGRMFSLTYSNHESFRALQPQVDEPKDPEPGEQLLVSKRPGGTQPSTVAGCHSRSVYSTSASVSLGFHRRSCPAGGSAGVKGWLLGAARRRRVAHLLRLERISGSWLKGPIGVKLSKPVQAIVGTP